MNFFGHAILASWRASDPLFALGAMLPDFATMIGERPPVVSSAELAGGVAFHHETDRVFHGSRSFGELERTARADLAARGLGRGSIRAVAHVGIEILLDDELARDEWARDGFRRALHVEHTAILDGHVHWQSTSAKQQLTRLLTAIRSSTEGEHRSGPELAAWRIERALAGRPRLALRAVDVAQVREWAASTAPVVASETPALILEMRSGLGFSS